MHSICAPRVTRQMSRRYSNFRQTLSSKSCVTFPIAVLMRSRNSGSVFGNTVLDETSQEEITQVWWPGWPGAEGVVCGHCTTNPSTWQCVISSCGVSSRTMFASHNFQRHYQNCERASTPQSGTSHKTCLRGFGGNGSIAWTSTVSHVGHKSNAFKVTMKLQTFLFVMVVTSCISVQYLWKYGFGKSSVNLYAPCISV